MPTPVPDDSDNSSIVYNYEQLENGKFIPIFGDSRFPPVSVVAVSHYPDTTQAFPQNTINQALTSTTIYPKCAILTYNVNQSDSTGFGIPLYDYVQFTLGSGALSGSPINTQYFINGPTGTMIAAVSTGYTNTAIVSSIYKYFQLSAYNY
jgi:hypothetical protein